jgi:hypothetical protein
VGLQYLHFSLGRARGTRWSFIAVWYIIGSSITPLTPSSSPPSSTKAPPTQSASKQLHFSFHRAINSKILLRILTVLWGNRYFPARKSLFCGIVKYFCSNIFFFAFIFIFLFLSNPRLFLAAYCTRPGSTEHLLGGPLLGV